MVVSSQFETLNAGRQSYRTEKTREHKRYGKINFMTCLFLVIIDVLVISNWSYVVSVFNIPSVEVKSLAVGSLSAAVQSAS